MATIEEQRAYDEWLQRARPLLEQAQWTEALRDVPRLQDLEPARPRPLRKPLGQARVALVTSAALAHPEQPPIDGAHVEGDYTIRLLDTTRPMTALQVWHTHFDTTAAREDWNVVYPLERLHELAAEGVIGEVAPVAVSFNGYFTNVFRIRDEVVPTAVDAVKAAGADAVVLVPI